MSSSVNLETESEAIIYCSSLNLAESLAPSSCFQHFLEVAHQGPERECQKVNAKNKDQRKARSLIKGILLC